RAHGSVRRTQPCLRGDSLTVLQSSALPLNSCCQKKTHFPPSLSLHISFFSSSSLFFFFSLSLYLLFPLFFPVHPSLMYLPLSLAPTPPPLSTPPPPLPIPPPPPSLSLSLSPPPPSLYPSLYPSPTP